MPYKSNMEQAGRAIHAARVRGLQMAGDRLIRGVVKRLAGGYTTGQWVSGTNTSSVVRTEPMRLRGIWTVLVGTSIDDPPYPLFWEVGFNQRQVAWKNEKGQWVSPKYIKRGKDLVLNPTKFVRKERWGPALREDAEHIQAAFVRGFRKALDANGNLRVAGTVRLRDVAEAAD